MPLWFTLALAAPMIWAIINHIDKFVLSRYAENKKPEALVVFSCLISGATAVCIFCFTHIDRVSLTQAIWAMIAGTLFTAGYIPYMYALQKDDVSIVAPLFQMIVPLSYLLGVMFLRESLSLHQIFASLLVVVGTVLLTLNVKKFAWKGKIFKLMFYACLFLTFNTVIFKFIGLESSFWTASFWEYLGAFLFGIVMLSIPAYRRDFKSFLHEGGRNIVSLNFLAEGLNVLGRMLFNFAALLAPIALVYVVSGTQPFFIFFFGIILFFFFPNIGTEDLSRKAIIVKVSAIFIMILGSALLFL